jgi:hypothetical protein
MFSNHAHDLPGQSEIIELHRSLFLWAASLLVIAGISMVGNDKWDFTWGIVLIVLLILTWKLKALPCSSYMP